MKIYLMLSLSGRDADEARADLRRYKRLANRKNETLMTPLAGENFVDGVIVPSGYSGTTACDRAVFGKSIARVRAADVVIVDLSRTGRSIGVAAEVGMAVALNKPIILFGYGSDLAHHAIILEAAVVHVATFEDALVEARCLLGADT